MWNWDEAYATGETGDPLNAADDADDKHSRRAWDTQNGELGTTLLGYVDVEGSDGSLWITIEPPAFLRLGGGGQEQIYFGYGDGPVPRNPIPEAAVVARVTCDEHGEAALKLRPVSGIGVCFSANAQKICSPDLPCRCQRPYYYRPMRLIQMSPINLPRWDSGDNLRMHCVRTLERRRSFAEAPRASGGPARSRWPARAPR